jgi:hypothetical protein
MKDKQNLRSDPEIFPAEFGAPQETFSNFTIFLHFANPSLTQTRYRRRKFHERGIEMSCPYLEKGKTAYCHAFENQKLAVESTEFAEFCFSGEFSECSFLIVPLAVEYGKSKGLKNCLSKPFGSFYRGQKTSPKGAAIG